MKLRVLIVEDAEPMTIVLQHILTEIGLEVVGIADTGEKAVDMAKTLQPDLITLDTVLPDIIGIDVLKSVKRFGITSKVIFISAAGSHKLIEEAMEAGADAYLLKPINADKIERKIKEVFETKHIN